MQRLPRHRMVRCVSTLTASWPMPPVQFGFQPGPGTFLGSRLWV